MRTTLAAILLILVASSLPRLAVAADMYPITQADKNFLAETLDAIKRNDVGWVASHMAYPLSVGTKQMRVVKTKEEFMPILSRELTESVRARITREANRPLFKNWQGVMVGDGILWFSGFQYEGDKSWRYGIFAIGLFAFQSEGALQPKEGAKKRAGGDGGTALLRHAGCPRPAAPHHDRSAKSSP